MKPKHLLLSTFLATTMCSIAQAQEKLLVITHSYNRPNLIAIQHKTFKQFLTDDYEFVVFNDASNPHTEQAIKHQCNTLGIRCIRVPQNIHGHRQHPCERCADVIQYSLDSFAFAHEGIVAIVDSDMFLIRKFSVIDYLKDHDIAGCRQSRGSQEQVIYMWNGLVFMNMQTLPRKRTINFDCGQVLGLPVDVGGQLHHYFKAHPELKIRWFNSHMRFNYLPDNPAVSLRTLDYPMSEILVNFMLDHTYIHGYSNDMELHYHGNFLHYRAGNNWQNYTHAYHAEKEQLVLSLINNLMNESK